MERLDCTYLVPLRADAPPSRDLVDHLIAVARLCPVLVVDGSDDDVFEAAHVAFDPHVTHVRPDRRHACLNGKVTNVLSGLDRVTTEVVVIADDDVRHTVDSLARCVHAARMESAVVCPQNHFVPEPGERLPWHAVWDTARSLLNRVTGGDLPGTLAVRADVLRATGGYDGDVLFENLELIRTVVAGGGRCAHRPDIHVPRRPPTTRHFAGQRVRQAYDEFARPRRMAAQLAIAPAIALAVRRRAWRRLGVASAVSIVAAEIGRRRHGGAAHFPMLASWCAPAWLVERGVCSWLAVVARSRGGVTYAGGRLHVAAHSTADVRARLQRRRFVATSAG